MSGIGFTNHDLVARSLDTNKDNKIDKNEVNNIHHFNGQEAVSVADLASSLKSDKFSIKNGLLAPGESINIHVKGLETLKQINSDASQWKPYASPVWDRYNLEGREGLRSVQSSSHEYASAIMVLRHDLERIENTISSSGLNDPISSNVKSQARGALNADRQLGYENILIDFFGRGGVADWIFDDPFARNTFEKTEPKYIEDKQTGQQVRNPNWRDPYENHINTALDKNRNLEQSYNILKNALYEIKDNTSHSRLPDIKANVVATDRSISAAFSNVNAIESNNAQGNTPDKVKEKLGKLSAEQAAQVGNRTVSWGLPAAGGGAAVGAVIGYFSGGKVPMSAAIGAGIGAVVAGGIGAIAGHSKDESFKKSSSELTIIGEKVTTYNTKDASSRLEGAANQTYGVIVSSNGTQTISRALGITETVKGIKSGVDNVHAESAEVLRAYQGTTAKEVLGKH